MVLHVAQQLEKGGWLSKLRIALGGRSHSRKTFPAAPFTNSREDQNNPHEGNNMRREDHLEGGGTHGIHLVPEVKLRCEALDVHGRIHDGDVLLQIQVLHQLLERLRREESNVHVTVRHICSNSARFTTRKRPK